ncbi:MAG: dihydroorotase family protein [Nitrososphaerales archaeon]|jgi:dihydroorotase
MKHDLVVAGKVVSPVEVRETEIGISDGRIAEMKRQGLTGKRIIRAGRALIFPGFIDAHVHMREPGWEWKEDFRTGSEAAVHGGVTTVADMPNNPRPAISPALLREKARLASEKALVDVRLYGGISHKELDELRRISSLVVGFKLYLAKTTGNLTFPPSELERAFSLVAGTGKPASLHCEDQGIIDERTRKLATEKRPDVCCDMRPPEAEAESVRRVVAALRSAPRLRANVCHASTEETLSAVSAARSQGAHLQCEAALHHLYFDRSEMLVNPLLRTNPPLRSDGDRAALLEGLKDGRVSFLVTDHAPHLREEKLSDGLSGVPGLDDYGHMVSWLIRREGVDPTIVARVACSNPASFIGLGDRGQIGVGMRADLSILDIRSPEVVRAEDVRSKCGWSPYEGIEFPGRTRWTIRGGEPLLDDCELVR